MQEFLLCCSEVARWRIIFAAELDSRPYIWIREQV